MIVSQFFLSLYFPNLGIVELDYELFSSIFASPAQSMVSGTRKAFNKIENIRLIVLILESFYL